MAGNSKEVARAHLADAGVEELPVDWDVVTLGDLFTEDRGIAVGVMYPGDHDPDGVPLIKAGDLNGSIINPQPDFRISKDKHHEYRRTALEGGELLMTLVGTVGQCAVVPPRMAGWNTARALRGDAFGRLIRERILSSSVCSSRPLQHLMDVWCNTTVQATLNLKEIRRALPFRWPPKQSRDAIAAFGTLDDKIELNRQMNATLEAMARALFRSWFVDFDPVRAKVDGRQPPGLDPATAALFPATFDETELGHIPHGWQVKTIDELAERVAMGPFGSSHESLHLRARSCIPVISGQHSSRHAARLTPQFNFVSPLSTPTASSAPTCPRGDVIFTPRGQHRPSRLHPRGIPLRALHRFAGRQFLRCAATAPFWSPPFYITSLFQDARRAAPPFLASNSIDGRSSILLPSQSLRAITGLPPSPPEQSFSTRRSA